MAKIRRKEHKQTEDHKSCASPTQLSVKKPLQLRSFAIMPRLSLFKKKKQPEAVEVVLPTNLTSTPINDGISVITPLTGMPPESSPTRLHAMGMDVAPVNSLACPSVDEVSVITSGIPSPDKASTPQIQNKDKFGIGASNKGNNTTIAMGTKRVLFPPPLPGEDDSNQDPSIYEDRSDRSAHTSPTNPPLHITGNIESFNREALRRQSQIKLNQTIQEKSSWLTRTKYFQKAVDASFDMVDVDKSGDVTLDEMYAGLLLVHLRLAVYVGAPACRPASRQYVSEIFHLLKSNDNDTLSREEFAVVMKILYSQVFTRIVIQWTLTLIIVPILAQYIIKYTNLAMWISHEFWKDLDDELDPIQRLLYKLWLYLLTLTPEWIDSIGRGLLKLLNIVPWETWEGLPKMILNSVLVFVAVPYALNHVEDFFRRRASERDPDKGKAKAD